jgi:hypothetical protein
MLINVDFSAFSKILVNGMLITEYICIHLNTNVNNCLQMQSITIVFLGVGGRFGVSSRID